jgi:hypothetical protein
VFIVVACDVFALRWLPSWSLGPEISAARFGKWRSRVAQVCVPKLELGNEWELGNE